MFTKYPFLDPYRWNLRSNMLDMNHHPPSIVQFDFDLISSCVCQINIESAISNQHYEEISIIATSTRESFIPKFVISAWWFGDLQGLYMLLFPGMILTRILIQSTEP